MLENKPWLDIAVKDLKDEYVHREVPEMAKKSG